MYSSHSSPSPSPRTTSRRSSCGTRAPGAPLTCPLTKQDTAPTATKCLGSTASVPSRRTSWRNLPQLASPLAPTSPQRNGLGGTSLRLHLSRTFTIASMSMALLNDFMYKCVSPYYPHPTAPPRHVRSARRRVWFGGSSSPTAFFFEYPRILFILPHGAFFFM